MKPTDEITTLVQRVQRGDLLAAELLYERFAAAMFLVSHRITNHRTTSEDILQEAFAKSFTKIETLKDRKRYGGWLKQMVVNGSIDAVRRSRQWESLEGQYHLTDESEATEEIPAATTEAIHKAISELPEKCRTVFSLYLIEGYTHKEIGEMLSLATSTSKSQYQYALKLLRQKLKS